jgi:hypothetical protein
MHRPGASAFIRVHLWLKILASGCRARKADMPNKIPALRSIAPKFDTIPISLFRPSGGSTTNATIANLFNEPVTERIGNPESAPNDPLGHRIQQQRIPCIHLHPIQPPYKSCFGVRTDA